MRSPGPTRFVKANRAASRYRTPITRPLESQSRRILWAVPAVILLLNWYAPGAPTVTQRLLASVIIATAAFPAYKWLVGNRTEVPFLPLMSGVYLVYFAVPVFLARSFKKDPYSAVVSDASLDKALLLAFLGLLLLYLGYYALIGPRLGKQIPAIQLHWNDRRTLQTSCLVFGSVGLAVYYLKYAVTFPIEVQQIVDLLWSLSDISIATLFALSLRWKLSVGGKIFLWCILLPIRIAIGLGAGFAAQGLEIGILLLLVYATMMHRFPIKAALIGLLLLPFLFASRNELRARTWNSLDSTASYGTDQSPMQRMITLVDAITYSLSSGGTSIQESVDFTVYRMSQLFLFSDVIDLTPAVVPYWNGQTYYPLFTKFIPRILWPEKPVEDVGQTFGHRYSFIDPADLLTSVNLPQLVEFYVNFGSSGVILGMFLLGIFYRAVQKLIGSEVSDIGGLACGCFTFMRLTLIESSLSLVIGGLIWLICLFLLLDYVLKVSEPIWGRERKARL